MRFEEKTDAWAALLQALAVPMACRAPLPAADRQWREGRQEAIRAALAEAGNPGSVTLSYYPFDRAYRFRTIVEPVVPPQPLRIPTSSGELRPAHRVGRVHLRLPLGEAALAVYSLDDLQETLPGHLFLPFRDGGAGRETYGAGRYVEVESLPGGVVEIDFNRAYNPDCAYGITAQCPITPEENTVPFAVAAGELAPPEH